jgi:hypothetical protein
MQNTTRFYWKQCYELGNHLHWALCDTKTDADGPPQRVSCLEMILWDSHSTNLPDQPLPKLIVELLNSHYSQNESHETPLSDTEKALNYYRSAVERRRPDYVPARVRLRTCVRSDHPLRDAEGHGYFAGPGECECESNEWGAISVRAENGKRLGVKPIEFEVTEWRANGKPPSDAAKFQ